MIGDVMCKILMYADDLVLVANSPHDLQINISILDEYFAKWGLTLNLGKSKIIVFRNGGPLKSNEHWHYRGEEIEVVNSYKYLNYTNTSTVIPSPF